MLDYGFTYIGKKKLRNGITTGTCATAATKAALHFMRTGEKVTHVELSLPNGQEVEVPIVSIDVENRSCTCYVEKFAGDDPDITNGLLVGVIAEPNREGTLVIRGGKGVGRVTKSGLPVDVGNAAINPIPLKMIREIGESFINGETGYNITVTVPKGEEIARKTLNPKLGILGGISILGTTGIVKPMSEEAFKESLRIELEMYVNRGHKKIILVPGNYGYDFCLQHYDSAIPYPVIRYSNFLGYILDQCERLGICDIILIGDLGKLIKVSGGIFHTHSRVSDCRLELMGVYSALLGVEQKGIKHILELPTTVAAIDYLEQRDCFDMSSFYTIIVDRVKKRVEEYCHNSLRADILLFSRDKGELGRSLHNE